MASQNQSTRLIFALFLCCTVMRLTLAQLSENELFIIRSTANPDFVVDAVDKVVQLKYYTGFCTQLWKFHKIGKHGLNNIISACYGTALDILRIPSASSRPSYVVLRDLDSSSFQKWNVTSEGCIVNTAKNWNLDVTNEKYASGTRLQVWKSNGRPAQLFRVERFVGEE